MRLLLLAALCCAPARAEEAQTEAPPRALGVGVNDLGGQLDYDFGRGHRLELRYLTGKEDSDEGRIATSVIGMRVYQRFRIQGIYHPYVGAEASFVQAKIAGGAYSVNGAAPGLFVGVDRDLGKRFSMGLDIGPYLFILHERSTNTRGTSFDVIANAFLLFHVY